MAQPYISADLDTDFTGLIPRATQLYLSSTECLMLQTYMEIFFLLKGHNVW